MISNSAYVSALVACTAEAAVLIECETFSNIVNIETVGPDVPLTFWNNDSPSTEVSTTIVSEIDKDVVLARQEQKRQEKGGFVKKLRLSWTEQI